MTLSEEEEEEEEKVPGEINAIRTENEKEIELTVYGETKENVKQAEESLKKLIDLQFVTDVFEDDKIGMLSETEEMTLQKKAHQLQLEFNIDLVLKCIQLKGSKESISDMRVKIVEVLNQVDKEASRKAQAEIILNVVQWKRMDSSETPYDPLTNLEIEEAYSAGKPEYVFKHPHSTKRFMIDFQKMEEIDHAMNNQTCRVKRIIEG